MWGFFCFILFCREFTIETEGKTFQLTKDMVNVKRFQKTLHGNFIKIQKTNKIITSECFLKKCFMT
jgi:hypothetical protein